MHRLRSLYKTKVLVSLTKANRAIFKAQRYIRLNVWLTIICDLNKDSKGRAWMSIPCSDHVTFPKNKTAAAKSPSLPLRYFLSSRITTLPSESESQSVLPLGSELPWLTESRLPMALASGLNGGGYAGLYPNQNGFLAGWNRALRLG
ncbi:MAG: hypothetical protein QOI34_1804 [Verrucomicrobiota bacterium]